MRWSVPGRIAGLATMAVFLIVTAGPAAEQDTPKLRYDFQKGRRYGYDVKIVANGPEAEKTLAGLLIIEALRTANDQFAFRTSGSFAGQIRGMQPSFGGFPAMPFPPHIGHDPWADRWVLDVLGKVIRGGCDDQIPYFLGPRDLLVIEPLPNEAQPTWQKSGSLRVTEHSPTSRTPIGPPDAVLVIGHDATQQADYAILATAPDTVRISKKCNLTTTSSTERSRRLTLSGKGELEFDRKLGVFKSGEMKYSLETKENELTVTVPITVTYRLLSDAELADHEKREKEDALARAKAAEPKPLSPAERAAILKDLAAGTDPERAKSALDRLSKAIVGEHPDEVSAALVPWLANGDLWVQAAAANALKVWATSNAEGALIAASRNENWMVRGAALEALGRLKSPAAAEAVAAQLPRNRHEASKALRAMGPVAEAATIALLNQRELWTRIEVHNILKHIGGKASLTALEEARQACNIVDRHSFEEALGTLRQRLSVPASNPNGGENPAPSQSADAGSAAVRVWHDASGVLKVEASFVELENDKVVLATKDGRTVRVSFDHLAEPDRRWIQSRKSGDAAKVALRTWRDRSGVFELEASFVGYADQKVTLKKKDGRTLQMPLEYLSQQDRDWIAKQPEADAANPFQSVTPASAPPTAH